MSQENENIEDRIKHIISTKLQDAEFQEGLDDKKKEFIDKIFELFPGLKDKSKVKNPVPVDTKIINDDNTEDEIPLSEFKYNNKIYYKDKFGAIWDNDTNIVGSSKQNDADGNPVCVFFDHDYKINIDIF